MPPLYAPLAEKEETELDTLDVNGARASVEADNGRNLIQVDEVELLQKIDWVCYGLVTLSALKTLLLLNALQATLKSRPNQPLSRKYYHG